MEGRTKRRTRLAIIPVRLSRSPKSRLFQTSFPTSLFSSWLVMPPRHAAPDSQSSKEPPLPHPAEDLSADDDLLSWVLVDQLGAMPNTKLGVHPQQVKFIGPVFKADEVLGIVKEVRLAGTTGAHGRLSSRGIYNRPCSGYRSTSFAQAKLMVAFTCLRNTSRRRPPTPNESVSSSEWTYAIFADGKAPPPIPSSAFPDITYRDPHDFPLFRRDGSYRTGGLCDPSATCWSRPTGTTGERGAPSRSLARGDGTGRGVCGRSRWGGE